MEVTRFDENDYSQGMSESPNGEWVRLADVIAMFDEYRQALRAAEAECAEWQKTYGKGGLAPSLRDAVKANDATRARLGLGKIGGGE